MKKSNSYFKWFLFPFGVTFFLGVYTFLILFIISQLNIIEYLVKVMPYQKLTGVNVLAIGTDDNMGTSRADTIMVAHLDPDKDRIGFISVPRDLQVNVEGYGMTKINHAYAYGNVQLLKNTVSKFLGIPIQYFVKVDLNGVRKLVDLVGGVEINIEKDFKYSDFAGDLHINFDKGNHILQGDDIVSYLRFRHDKNGDIGRINRQQLFVKSLAGQLFSPEFFFKIPRFLDVLKENFNSNLTFTQIISMASLFKTVVEAGHFESVSLPGAVILKEGVSYWKPDILALDKVVHNTLLGFDKEVFTEQKVVKTLDRSASKEKRRNLSINEVSRISSNKNLSELTWLDISEQLKVEILNGMGIPGEAKRAAQFLKERGIQVVKFGNAGSFDYNKTTVVDWKGTTDKVIEFAQLLNVDPRKIIVYDRHEKPLDVTIVLGHDWEFLLNKIIGLRS